jgi:hypothetical protein
MISKDIIDISSLTFDSSYKNPVQSTHTQSIPNTQAQCKINCSRNFNKNLAGNDFASQYQRQKIIQNTVRIYASLYTMNLAGLSSYQKPLNEPQFVEQAGTQYIVPAKTYWNQMSDRARPANQVTKVASGSTYHSSSTRHTITRNKPGAMSPGGIGVDIKHNSYNRYLNKIKGKAPLRRGVIHNVAPILFNRAYPIYGGKIVKTSIINNCDCVDNHEQDKLIYGSSESALQDKILSISYTFNIGDFVWAIKYETDPHFHKGEIIDIVNDLYTVKFEDNIIRNIPYCELTIYFDCNCTPSLSFIEQILLNAPNTRTNPLSCRDLVLESINN